MGKFKGESEDETRGRGKVNPRQYKGDVITQVWLDSRMLATLSNWLDVEGIFPRFLSEVVRETLEMVIDNVVSSGKIDMVEDTDKARNLLQRRYRINLNPKNKKGGDIGGKNVSHNQVLSGRLVERSGQDRFVSKGQVRKEQPLPLPVQEQEQEQPTPVVSKAEIEQGVKIYEELRKKELKEAAKAEIEQVLANADIDEDGVIRPREDENGKGGNVGEKEYREYLEREKKREEMEGLDREKKRLEKRREKLLNILDEEREKEEDES